MYLARARQLPCVGNHTRIGIFDGTYFKFCHFAQKFDGPKAVFFLGFAHDWKD